MSPNMPRRLALGRAKTAEDTRSVEYPCARARQLRVVVGPIVARLKRCLLPSLPGRSGPIYPERRSEVKRDPSRRSISTNENPSP